jgi:hypothetical protein
VSLDGAGRLHVAARGTFAWAVYPYADDITGPYDTAHDRLYFGEADINFRLIVDPYEPGSTWSYTLPELVVSGIHGTFTMVARPSDPGRFSSCTLPIAPWATRTPTGPGSGGARDSPCAPRISDRAT